ncbi:MAG TPA: methionine synthase [Bacteroidota bacterium]|nr:methionine synthase [Bacteroidota bacterium]
MKSFLETLNEKIIVFDGAMGTNIQTQHLTADDFGGEQYNGCNEYLLITKPSAIEKVHADFLTAGVDVIETDSFGSAPIVLAEYILQDRAYELNVKSAQLAKKVARDFSKPGHVRYVAGSIGPTTKLPSLGHISFKEMSASYYLQVSGLIDGGVDLLMVETCQDILQTKACLSAVFQCFRDKKVKLPVVASVTIEQTGTMLMGTEVAAALTALEPFDISVIGMNCATGPKEMSENIRYLCSNSPIPVSCIPNAGLPENVGGHAHYHLSPEDFSGYLKHFVKDLGVSVVGGCCGTRPEHLRALVESVGTLSPRKRTVEFTPSASCMYSTSPFYVNPAPVIVGERANANGSKKFRELLQAEDYDSIVNIGKEQVKEGAHILDLCVAYVGRDEVRDMHEAAFRYNTQVALPVMIDSTETPVIEEALQLFAGKCIVNSVNMEDGEERINSIVPLCKRYGAAVVALTIDEAGMAKTAEKKAAIASRIYDLVIGTYGLKPHDLIFDTLTFTLGSGEEEFRKAGIETIEGIRLIKKKFPEVKTLLGVSNISFGLGAHMRHVLNSVFLHYAIEAGLDMAIVNAQKILPLYKIDEKGRELCRQLIFDERKFDGDRCVFDPLRELMAHYADKKHALKEEKKERAGTIEEILKSRIVDGDKQGLNEDLETALKTYTPLDIINTILLDGMKVVGDLFGRGEMQLPFVLQSAEVMKTAVAYLEQYMEKSETTSKGSMVLATVKGDVHDIGKNLVDIILTNNGYTVHNIGIKQPIENIIKKLEETNADAIGMSGLLVKSTLVMKENLEVLNERGLMPPIVLGGAALTRRYVENDLRAIYKGVVSYAGDAFDGLHFMEKLKTEGAGTFGISAVADASSVDGDELLTGSEAKIALSLNEETRGSSAAAAAPKAGATTSHVKPAEEIPEPPFWGTRVVTDLSLDDIYPYINESALIKGQWQVRKGKRTEDEYRTQLETSIYPDLRELKELCKREHLLKPKVVYGYFPCQSSGDDLIIYGDDKKTERTRFTFPRQTDDRFLCLADFFASVSSGRMDVVAFHMVTMGREASDYSAKLFAANDYKKYLYFHGLSVETTEALAELWHKKIREELGIASQDAPEIKRLFSQGYRGSRYSFGYAACPNLEDHVKLFALLDPGQIGVKLTEEFMLEPEQSTDAIIVHHPQAKYFNIK